MIGAIELAHDYKLSGTMPRHVTHSSCHVSLTRVKASTVRRKD